MNSILHVETSDRLLLFFWIYDVIPPLWYVFEQSVLDAARLPQLFHLWMKFVQVLVGPLHLIRWFWSTLQNDFPLLSIGSNNRIRNIRRLRLPLEDLCLEEISLHSRGTRSQFIDHQAFYAVNSKEGPLVILKEFFITYTIRRIIFGVKMIFLTFVRIFTSFILDFQLDAYLHSTLYRQLNILRFYLETALLNLDVLPSCFFLAIRVFVTFPSQIRILGLLLNSLFNFFRPQILIMILILLILFLLFEQIACSTWRSRVKHYNWFFTFLLLDSLILL